jgi:lipopolysaccharide heptosyltransferase I
MEAKMFDTTLRILLCRLSAVGDVVHGVPVLGALREHYPTAFLAWVVEPGPGELLRGHRALDELVVAPRGWCKSPGAIWRLRKRLRELRFNLAIDMQGLTKSALAAWLSGAPRRIGFGDEKGRELSRWMNNELVTSTAPHIIDCNLQLLTKLGIVNPAVKFDLPESDEDRAAAEAMVAAAGVGGEYGLINVGAGWTSKLWPAERYAAVARHLGEARGLPTLVLWAGAQERGVAEQIVAGAAGHARLAPATSLRELAALARRGRLFVGSDTGPLHIAAAVDTPCVGLFGPMPAERNGPYGAKHVAIQKMRFQGSSRERRHASPSLMEAISVGDVCEACDRILDRPKVSSDGTQEAA